MDDWSRFAILAAEPPKPAIPPDLITGLEIACTRGPLGPYERRPIGSVYMSAVNDAIAALNEGLHPQGLHVTEEPVEQADGRVTLAVRRWTGG